MLVSIDKKNSYSAVFINNASFSLNNDGVRGLSGDYSALLQGGYLNVTDTGFFNAMNSIYINDKISFTFWIKYNTYPPPYQSDNFIFYLYSGMSLFNRGFIFSPYPPNSNLYIDMGANRINGGDRVNTNSALYGQSFWENIWKFVSITKMDKMLNYTLMEI